MHSVVADAEPIRDPGSEGLDEHIGGVGQLQEGVEARSVLQIDGHRALRAVPDGEAAVVAERVATGRFDLDDVGALLGEELHAERAGDPPREVEHAQSVEGSGHRVIFASI